MCFCTGMSGVGGDFGSCRIPPFNMGYQESTRDQAPCFLKTNSAAWRPRRMDALTVRSSG
jgi:hypothetical protein